MIFNNLFVFRKVYYERIFYTYDRICVRNFYFYNVMYV